MKKRKKYSISLPKIYRDLLYEERIEYKGAAHGRLKSLENKEKVTKIRREIMENKKYEIPFDKRPSSFGSITVWDYPYGIEFAIQQLEASGKKYCIERVKDKIRVWSQTYTIS